VLPQVIAIKTSKLVRLYGKVENTERFLSLALFQGRAELDLTMLGSGVKISQEEDPTLICCAFKKSRFYLFTRREPEEPEGDQETGRDVFNEKPSKDDLALAQREERGQLSRMATLNTSYGEVRIKLFPDECPRTVENFVTHARNGYYDGVVFHRVIKGFMVQVILRAQCPKPLIRLPLMLLMAPFGLILALLVSSRVTPGRRAILLAMARVELPFGAMSLRTNFIVRYATIDLSPCRWPMRALTRTARRQAIVVFACEWEREEERIQRPMIRTAQHVHSFLSLLHQPRG